MRHGHGSGVPRAIPRPRSRLPSPPLLEARHKAGSAVNMLILRSRSGKERARHSRQTRRCSLQGSLLTGRLANPSPQLRSSRETQQPHRTARSRMAGRRGISRARTTVAMPSENIGRAYRQVQRDRPLRGVTHAPTSPRRTRRPTTSLAFRRRSTRRLAAGQGLLLRVTCPSWGATTRARESGFLMKAWAWATCQLPLPGHIPHRRIDAAAARLRPIRLPLPRRRGGTPSRMSTPQFRLPATPRTMPLCQSSV